MLLRVIKTQNPSVNMRIEASIQPYVMNWCSRMTAVGFGGVNRGESLGLLALGRAGLRPLESGRGAFMGLGWIS
jgi:hypothetical protein